VYTVTDTTNFSRLIAPIDSHAKPRFSVPLWAVEPLFALADVVIIVAAGAAGGVLYHVLYHHAFHGGVADVGMYAGLGLVASLAYVLVAQRLGLYRLDRLLEREPDGGQVWLSLSLAILLLAVFLFLFKFGAEASRGSVVCLLVLSGLSLVPARRVARRRLRAALTTGVIHGRRAIVIGTGSELSQLGRQDLMGRFGLDEVARIVLPCGAEAKPSSGLRKPDAEKALQGLREALADEIVVAVPWAEAEEIEWLTARLRMVPLPARLLPDRAMSTVLRHQASFLQRSYMVELQRAPLNPFERTIKRLLDVTVAAVALFLLAPLLLVAAVAIKLESRGPVIFRQQRHGFNGQPFEIYKLRTMKVLEEGAAVVQATEKDPRVTRVGRFLRASSIDELPQLLNVLQGHMSIVGPRPHALIHDYEYGRVIANYAFRHHVKPGITGWAQIQGYRGGTPRLELMERRVTLDLWYIDNWSLVLDIGIIFRTFLELVRQRNAY
jgi:undecaprenyl-phosphate galactose phosphotransferase/putative colanic acid biosynthesis UDP-glucose lipid carrier transferase